MKKLDQFLNVLMGSFFGVFIGNTIFNYREYLQMPDVYAMRSQPWYCYGALSSFLLFVGVVVICGIMKLFIRRRESKR